MHRPVQVPLWARVVEWSVEVSILPDCIIGG
jgi:hypothetical protein